MTSWLEAVLDARGQRPASVTWAAVLGLATGAGSLVAGIVVVGTLVAGAGGMAAIAWPVVAAQVAAAALLIVGAARLAVAADRRALLAGATLHFAVCAAYLFYVVASLAEPAIDPPGTIALMIAVPVGFTAVPAISLLLALLPTSASYVAAVG